MTHAETPAELIERLFADRVVGGADRLRVGNHTHDLGAPIFAGGPLCDTDTCVRHYDHKAV